MITIRYDVLIQDNIKKNLKNFQKFIQNTLSDKRSWKFNFLYDKKNPNFLIILSKARTINNICGFSNLSCADRSNNIIYINYSRWLNGAKKSGLSLIDYRKYLINNEVGHILGLNHYKRKKNKKVPIMYQSTLGIYDSLPNCYPLPWEHKNISIRYIMERLINSTYSI